MRRTRRASRNVVATVRVPGSGRRRWDQQTRTFGSTLAGRAELAAWLAEAGVKLVGMEATGAYWKTVFQALEARFECWLLNAPPPAQRPRPRDRYTALFAQATVAPDAANA